MLRRIRKSKTARIIAVYLALNLLFELISPSVVFALTGGPSQPEVQSFQPIGTSDMVDVFTGDFKYNIPLMDVGGYPINIAYNAGITMDQEASWVGLGWNINPGVITRNMRGLPDDFSGDEVEQQFNMEPNRTIGATMGFSSEVFGLDFTSLSYSLGINYNNYNGIGFEQSINPSISASRGGDEDHTVSLGLNLTANSEGLNLSPSVSFSDKVKTAKNGDVQLGATIGVNINSRAGLKSLTISPDGKFLPEKKTSPGKLKDLKKASKAGKVESSLKGSSGGSPISLVGNTYVPQQDMPRLNASISFSAKFGGELFGAEGSYNVAAYYSENRLLKKSQKLGAYGYLNEQYGYAKDEVLLDFNREKDRAFTSNTPNLPVTNHTYDIYSVAGQGIGGMFRPFRSEAGYVHDSYVNNISASGSLGLELSSGNAFHIGADINVNAVSSTSGNWNSGNDIKSNLKFNSQQVNSEAEPVYFKEAGEKSVDSEASFLSSIGGYEAVRIPIAPGPGFQSKTKNQFKNKYGTVTQVTGPISRAQRVKRNQSISYLTKSEAALYGLEKYTSTYGKSHHISEISALKTDGMRYVYGIPAYNITQKEVSFNISGETGDCSTGLVPYNSTDASADNTRGRDHYYNATITPSYAHSYLLTAVLSPDYVDVDQVTGPSAGDLGNYTHFVYDGNASLSGQQPTISNYRWRTPFNSGMANYSEGLKTDAVDNKGSFIYGEKELWYLDKIETKTHVAVFHKSGRKDGYEVAGEAGGLGQDVMVKLDSISLYSYPDYEANGNNAMPIKRVHFRYDYSMCTGIPNNDGAAIDEDGNNPSVSGKANINSGGKLTLKKVFFTYQRSFKGKLSSYEFNYADLDNDGTVDANYGYNIKGYDRWGYYMPNPGGSNCDVLSGALPAADFPYVDQTTTTLYAAAWSLTSIKLPSGGKIVVDYESDDYAYVQDKQAMQMFKVVGCGLDPATDSPTGSNTLYSTSNGAETYLYFTLETPISTSASSPDDEVKNKYLKDIRNGFLYFRFLMDLTDANSTSSYEYVSGYAQIDGADAAGVVDNSVSGGAYTCGYVKVKKVYEGDSNISGTPADHPISKAAWHFGRMHTPRLVYNLPDPSNGTNLEDVLQGILNASIINGIVNLFRGPNGELKSKGYGKRFAENKSWIRLYSPDKIKKGGGIRVSSIRIYDNWDVMVGTNPATSQPYEDEFEYGQEYTYKLEDGVTSSGVAAYEPMPGGDENPFRQPVFFSEERLLAPDDRHYMEEPFGESFFPSPGVGYSRVEVKNLQYNNVKRHATGKVVHEYYTAKDFPTFTDRTTLDPLPQKTSPLSSIFSIAVKDYMTTTQGYVIELNDMHGKEKAQWVYAEGQDTPISGVEYKYQTQDVSNTYSGFPGMNATVTKTVLDNNVVVIDKEGGVSYKDVGVDFDFVSDFRQSFTQSHSVSAQGNFAAFFAAIFPIAVPTVWPSYATQKTRFRSAVTTKVINRYGIIRETIAYDLGSQVSTENLAYDAQTGEVLLTRTKNEFNDPVYNFTYPAHWAYDRMGQAYQNIQFIQSIATISSGGSIPSGTYKLVKGDEVIVKGTIGSTPVQGKAWIWDTDDNVNNGCYIIDVNGEPFNPSSSITSATLKVIRSGRRNTPMTPVGTITSSQNPLKDNTAPFDGKYDALVFDVNTKVLNASVNEFSDQWGIHCNELAKFQQDCNCTGNMPLISGLNELLSHFSAGSNICQNHTIPPNEIPNLLTAFATTNNVAAWSPGSCTSTTSYTGMFNNNSSLGVSYMRCNITFTPVDIALSPISLPSGFDWSHFTGFSTAQMITQDADGGCLTGSLSKLLATALFNNGTSTTSIDVTVETSCINVGECVAAETCDTLPGDIVNPFVAGIRGTWRPLRSRLYLTDRTQNIVSNNTSIRTDGSYTSFTPFWTQPLTGSGNPWGTSPSDWQFTSEVSKYTPYGNEIENRDALDRYSAALFGYNNQLVKAVASNATYKQIAFDGMEDYDFINIGECCQTHWDFYDPASTFRTNLESHTGKYSLLVPSNGGTRSTERGLETAAPATAADDMPYTVKESDINGTFSPPTYNGNKEYVISYWVKQAPANNARAFDYPDLVMNLYVNNVLRTPTSTQKGSIIDGWQRVEARFSILGTDAGNFKVEFVNNNASIDAYVDDVRIQPFLSSMKTYVFDPVSLKLWAELDERNYATFYEYDEEGSLMRIKKETEKGIMTIQESRNNTIKK